jgi:ketosteroid isomerase-like protein
MSELELLLEAYESAIFEKDLESFLALFDDQVRVFDMWGQWSYDGLAAWGEMVKGWFSSLGADRDRLTLEEVEFFFGGDLATVTAFARFAAISPNGEELRFLYNRLTLVVRLKTGPGPGPGVWKIIHQHTSAPIDGETLRAILQPLQTPDF